MVLEFHLLRLVLTLQAILSTLQTDALEQNTITGIYISRGERTVNDYYVLEQHVLRSKIECTTMCMISSLCTGVSWKFPENECLLTRGDTAAQGEENNHFLAAANWDAMIKILYPVAIYWGPLGFNDLTFNEAELLCEEKNTSIASDSDLLYAKSLGYEKCECGWMSNATNALVMQEYDPECGGPFQICGLELANVFCLVPEYVYP